MIPPTKKTAAMGMFAADSLGYVQPKKKRQGAFSRGTAGHRRHDHTFIHGTYNMVCTRCDYCVSHADFAAGNYNKKYTSARVIRSVQRAISEIGEPPSPKTWASVHGRLSKVEHWIAADGTVLCQPDKRPDNHWTGISTRRCPLCANLLKKQAERAAYEAVYAREISYAEYLRVIAEIKDASAKKKGADPSVLYSRGVPVEPSSDDDDYDYDREERRCQS